MGDMGYFFIGVAVGVGALYGYHRYVRPLPAPDCGCGGHDEPAPESDVAGGIGEAQDGELADILAGRAGGE